MNKKLENKISIEDMEVGKSYACYFEITTMLDSNGQPARGNIGETFPGPGSYEGFGIITTRDLKTSKLIVFDLETQRDYVVEFDNVWGVDEAVITEQET